MRKKIEKKFFFSGWFYLSPINIEKKILIKIIFLLEIQNQLDIFPSSRFSPSPTKGNGLDSNEANGFRLEDNLNKISDFNEISIDYANSQIYVGAK